MPSPLAISLAATSEEISGESTELDLRRQLAQNPRDPEALYRLGMLCFDSGRRIEGLHLVRQATEAAPQNVDYLSGLSILLGMDEQFQKSAEVAYRVLVIEPFHAPTHNNLGVTLETLGRFDEAVKAFSRAVQIVPDNAVFHCHLGNALRKSGRPSFSNMIFLRHGKIWPAYCRNRRDMRRRGAHFAKPLRCHRRMPLNIADSSMRCITIRNFLLW